ncbi:MAG: 2OG-Fe(II) oxygenase, partial [Microcystis sp.]
MYPKDCPPVLILSVPYYFQYPDAFTPSYLSELQGQIL